MARQRNARVNLYKHLKNGQDAAATGAQRRAMRHIQDTKIRLMFALCSIAFSLVAVILSICGIFEIYNLKREIEAMRKVNP